MNLLGSVCYDDDHGSRDGDIKRIYSRISFCLSCFQQYKKMTSNSLN